MVNKKENTHTNTHHDDDDDILFHVIDEKPKAIVSNIERLRNTNVFNKDDKIILQNIHHKKKQTQELLYNQNLNAINYGSQSEESNFINQTINNEFNENNLNYSLSLMPLENLDQIQNNANNINDDTLKYALKQTHSRHILYYISILFLCGLSLYLIISQPTLPPAGIMVDNKYYVFKITEYSKVKHDVPVIAKPSIKVEQNKK